MPAPRTMGLSLRGSCGAGRKQHDGMHYRERNLQDPVARWRVALFRRWILNPFKYRQNSSHLTHQTSDTWTDATV